MPSPTPTLIAGLHPLTPIQREMVEREIRLAEGALNGRPMHTSEDMTGVDIRSWEGRNFTPPDPAILREQIRRDRETLARGTPPAFNGFQKNKIHKMVEEAEALILDGMLTHEEMSKATHGNVEHFIRHEEYTRQAQMIYLNGLRILDPEHDSISIEHLRDHQGGKRSRKPWEVGYVKITWTAEEELEDALANLDDSTYLQFLQLRLQGVTTPKLLQQQLGVGQATYEACLRRLEQAPVAPDVAQEPAPAPRHPYRDPQPPIGKAPAKQAHTVEEDAQRLTTYYEKYGMDKTERVLAMQLKMSVARVQAAQAHLAATEDAAAVAD